MKIIVEANIPYIHGLLEEHGEVLYLPADRIDADAVRKADALFVRTRTRCDSTLLRGSSVRFIATATIGTDHIDLEYCRKAGIHVSNAPGCNAPAVAQYVFATIAAVLVADDLRGMTLGVVGVGHVGSIVGRWGERLGMNVMRCDPPRARRENGDFSTLRDIADHADIITFHTPLTHIGRDATWHLCDEKLLAQLKNCRLLINSARGAVVDNTALLRAIETGSLNAAIDCWENEPNINLDLLRRLQVATPHIAGYSAEGKSRATAMALTAFEQFFAVTVNGKPEVSAPLLGADITSLAQVAASYNPLADTVSLKAEPDAFERLRNAYNLRNEVR